jgi:hypothetical protein
MYNVRQLEGPDIFRKRILVDTFVVGSNSVSDCVETGTR